MNIRTSIWIIASSLWIGSCQPRSRVTLQEHHIQDFAVYTEKKHPMKPIIASWKTLPTTEWVELQVCAEDTPCRIIPTILEERTLYGVKPGPVDISIRGCTSKGCNKWLKTQTSQAFINTTVLGLSQEVANLEDKQQKEILHFVDLFLDGAHSDLQKDLPHRIFLLDALHASANLTVEPIVETSDLALTRTTSDTRVSNTRSNPSPRPQTPSIEANTPVTTTVATANHSLQPISKPSSLFSRTKDYLMGTQTFQATAASASAWAFAYSNTYGLGSIRNWVSGQVVKSQPIQNKDFKEPIEKFIKKWSLSVLEHKFNPRDFSEDLKLLFQDLTQGPIQKSINIGLQGESPLRVLQSDLSDAEYHQKLMRFLQTDYDTHISQPDSNLAYQANMQVLSQQLTQVLSRSIAWDRVETRDRILPKIEYQVRQSLAALVEYKRLRSYEADATHKIKMVTEVGSQNISELLKSLLFDVGLMKTDDTDFSKESRKILESSFLKLTPRMIENAILPNSDKSHPYQVRRIQKIQRKIQSLENIKDLSDDIIKQLPQQTLENIATAFIGKNIYKLGKRTIQEQTRVIIKNIIQNAIQHSADRNRHRIQLAVEFEEKNGHPPSEHSVIWNAKKPPKSILTTPKWFQSQSSWISDKTGSFVEKSIFKAVDQSVPIDRLYFLLQNKRTAPGIVKSMSNNIIKSIVKVHIDPGTATKKSTQDLLNTYIWARSYQTGMILLKIGSFIGLATIGYIILQTDSPDSVFYSPEKKQKIVIARDKLKKLLDEYKESANQMHLLSQLEAIKSKLGQ